MPLPPPPIPVKSVSAASLKLADPVQLLATDTEEWCQANAPVGPGEPLTITLAAPAPIGEVALRTGDTISAIEVTADGVPFRATTAPGAMRFADTNVALSGAPVTTLVIRLVVAKPDPRRPPSCASQIGLRAPDDPPVIEAADAAAALAFWPDVVAARDAVVACNKSALAKVATFPFVNGWSYETIDGIQDESKKYASAGALAAACKRKQLRGAAFELPPALVRSESATAVEVHGDNSSWRFELARGRWKLRSFRETL